MVRNLPVHYSEDVTSSRLFLSIEREVNSNENGVVEVMEKSDIVNGKMSCCEKEQTSWVGFIVCG